MPPAASIIPALLLLTLLPAPGQAAISFDYSNFSGNMANISRQGDASFTTDAISLTKDQVDGKLQYSSGRAVYAYPLHLWDKSTRQLANFTTRFSFTVNSTQTKYQDADGLAFFLAPNGSNIPNNTSGGGLALFTAPPNSSSVSTVAVEFDTFVNPWDPDGVHVGIDVGSIRSAAFATWWPAPPGFNYWVNATVVYDAGTTSLRVFFSDGNGTERALSHVVDLSKVLPEWVSVGFSASTAITVAVHRMVSWSFRSSALQEAGGVDGGDSGHRMRTVGVVLGAVVGVLLVAGAAWFTVVWRRKRGSGGRRRRQGTREPADLVGAIDDVELEGRKGPRSFTYRELARATRNFAEEGRLGRGGFGDVYRGLLLGDPSMEVAIKRVAKDSKQGAKEYVSEVKVISRLRHRNLVQLVGWSHELGELLLVYEYMPNGSLDAHLFGGRPPLPWPTRYGIAQGVAAALLYLHEEWEQCVVHRDVKSSNVMLDAGLNAKLGDFGLARLVDHGQGMQTTVLAGTTGYLAPECFTTGRASTESDVYSFGVVALEVACGRRPVAPAVAGEGQVVLLVEWVWEMYGRHAVVVAADERLGSDFDGEQMERLMVVGLWCAHPDFQRRPSMRQVVSALCFETPPPELPPRMPVPTYVAPAPDMADISLPSSTSAAGYTTGSSVTSTAPRVSASDANPLLLEPVTD